MNYPRRFQLRRYHDESGVSGLGIVAHGVEWGDGKVATHWNFDITHTDVWDSMDHMISVHGHGGATVVEWIDEVLTENPIEAQASQVNG